MKLVLILVGTRPNFIKITQFKKVSESFSNLEIKVVHTGQHFNKNMADIFFEEFDLKPDYFLNIKPDHPINQIAEITTSLKDLCDQIGKPDLLIVPGDVNSTVAGALFANKMGIKLAHLESGLRSFDRGMPEEHNRIVTDNLSDLLFVTEQSGLDNIKNEQITGQPYFVGNTMIDTLVAFTPKIDLSTIIERLEIKRKYAVLTIHRPSNVDNKNSLSQLLELFSEVSNDFDLLFPAHPRTLKNIENYGLEKRFKSIPGLKFLDPLGYFDFQKLIKNSSFVLTDSGGIQEETTFLRVPCITIRDNTERPITCEIGSNSLLKFKPDKILETISNIKDGNYKKGQIPPLWDGKSTERILKIVDECI